MHQQFPNNQLNKDKENRLISIPQDHLMNLKIWSWLITRSHLELQVAHNPLILIMSNLFKILLTLQITKHQLIIWNLKKENLPKKFHKKLLYRMMINPLLPTFHQWANKLNLLSKRTLQMPTLFRLLLVLKFKTSNIINSLLHKAIIESEASLLVFNRRHQIKI